MLYQDITSNKFGGQSSKNAFHRHRVGIRIGYSAIILITGSPNDC